MTSNSNPSAFANLVRDVELVVAYAARSGRPLDKTLFETVTEMRTRLDTNANTQEDVPKLLSSLNNALQAIAPVTLFDLGSTWRPFPSSKWNRLYRVLFAMIATLVILLAAYYTQYYSQTASVLSNLQSIQAENVADTSERLFRFVIVNHDSIFHPHDSNSDDLTFEPYLKYYEELQDANDKLITYKGLSGEVIDQSHDLTGSQQILEIIRSLFGRKANDFGSSTGTTVTPASIVPVPNAYSNYGEQKSASPKSSVVPMATTASASPKSSFVPMATTASASASLNAQDPFSAAVDGLAEERKTENLILFDLGLGYLAAPSRLNNATSPESLADPIYECQRIVAMMGTWVLPALYGLLGAIVFQMRAIMNPSLPDPPIERLFIRFSLGALAGVSSTWFYGITSPKLFEGQSLGTSFLGIAFLLGFSIDIFFAILDRLVILVSQAIVKVGG